MPPELVGGRQLYLGLSLDSLRALGTIRAKDSEPGFEDRLGDSGLFAGADYNRLQGSAWCNPDKLWAIELSGPGKFSTVNTDSVACYIVSVCTRHFGENYEIRGLVTGGVNVAGTAVPYPILIWNADSCSVTFSFIPHELWCQLDLVGGKPVSPMYNLTLSYLLPYYAEGLKRSTTWTRERLGVAP